MFLILTVHRLSTPNAIDTFMQKTKRLYQDTRTQSNLTKLHEDLQDVTKIMTKNMEDLLYRYFQDPFFFHHVICSYAQDFLLSMTDHPIYLT